MKTRWILLGLLLLVGGLRAQDAPAVQYRIAGSQDRLWLLEKHADGFNLYQRQDGAKWTPIVKDFSGKAFRPTTVGELLHLFFAGGQHLSFDADGRTMTQPNVPGTLLATATVRDALGATRPTMIALVRGVLSPPSERPDQADPSDEPALSAAEHDTPATQRAADSTPTTQDVPPGEGLLLYRFTGTRWDKLAAWPDAPREMLRDGDRLELAGLGNRVYVAMRNPGATPRFVCWDYTTGDWTPLPWPDEEPGSASLLRIRKSLVGLFGPDEGQTQPLRIRTWDPKTNSFGPSQTIRRQDAPMDWPARPTATAYNREIYLLWGYGGETRLAACSLSGELHPAEDISDSLRALPNTELSEQLMKYFVLGIFVALLAAMFLLPTRAAAMTFSLPPTMVPGNLLKRLAAALIDFVPFNLVLLFLFGQDRLEEIVKTDKLPEPTMVIAAMISITGYLIYNILMEQKFGATVGKLIVRQRVVGTHGTRPTFRESVVRNLMKLWEISLLAGPTVWFFGLLMLIPLLNRNRQRLGDMFAPSAVVEAKTLPLPQSPKATEAELPGMLTPPRPPEKDRPDNDDTPDQAEQDESATNSEPTKPDTE